MNATLNYIYTVAAVVERDGQFLIIEEYGRDGKPVFNQPAGHVEQGETLIEAVVRETMEEAGYLFTPSYFLGCFTYLPYSSGLQTIPYKRFAFVGSVGKQINTVLDDGIIAAHWLSHAQLASQPNKLRSHLVLHTIEAYLSGQKFALQDAQAGLYANINTNLELL